MQKLGQHGMQTSQINEEFDSLIQQGAIERKWLILSPNLWLGKYLKLQSLKKGV